MIIGDFSDLSSDENASNLIDEQFEKIFNSSNTIKLKRDEMEFLCNYKFENDKVWELFRCYFFSDFLIKNKILLEAYADQIKRDYEDVISRLDE